MVIRLQLILVTSLFLLASLLNVGFAEELTFPAWHTLKEEERVVLAPLAQEWDSLRPWQRDRMLEIARDYPKMPPERQARVQKRLQNWAEELRKKWHDLKEHQDEEQ